MGEWKYRSTILELGTEWRWAASRLDHFTSGERAHGKRCRVGWVGPRVGLNAVDWSKISCRSSSPQPVAIPTELSELLKIRIQVGNVIPNWSVWACRPTAAQYSEQRILLLTGGKCDVTKLQVLKPVENSAGTFASCYASFRTALSTSPASPAFSLVLLLSPTCYRIMHRSQHLAPSPTNNT
jgi:hypothetical protein